MSRRTIFKRAGSDQAATLLQSLFAAELIAPGKRLTIISPWITDMPVLDNRGGGFQGLEPDWPVIYLPLSTVLTALAERGVEVRVLTRDKGNEAMVQKLLAIGHGRAIPLLARTEGEDLHRKGIAGDRFRLLGSMNFTTAGVRFNDEQIEYSTEADDIAEARRDFDDMWQRAER